ncbi:hypothetical protein [Spirillospora sp. CA-294931]|uniref:hypothetical protein n=1 Tax=Spirillospora sp. CA-294931 TaxID=3240042 RepID=UPI003D90B94E
MYDSIIRTTVPLIVAVLLGQAARVGLDLDPGAVTSIVTTVIGAVYYTAARALEQHMPTAGRVLLSAGLATRAPEYHRPR